MSFVFTIGKISGVMFPLKKEDSEISLVLILEYKWIQVFTEKEQ